jgi:hypothetical protein
VADDRVVNGTVMFAQALPPVGAVVHVLVEEVTRADAAATVAARLDTPLSAAMASGRSLAFSLPVPNVDAAKRYTVRVHVDRSGNGRIEAGDQISTRSYPVLTQGAPPDATVAVTTI